MDFYEKLPIRALANEAPKLAEQVAALRAERDRLIVGEARLLEALKEATEGKTRALGAAAAAARGAETAEAEARRMRPLYDAARQAWRKLDTMLMRGECARRYEVELLVAAGQKDRDERMGSSGG